MRRIAYAAVMLMGVLTIAGCARMDEILTGRKTQVTFVASFDDATRTSIQSGGKVDWVEGDAIRYYTKKGGSIEEYEVVRSGHSTNVVADVTSGTSYIIAAYGGTGITDNTVTSFTLNGAVKAEQTGKFEDAHVSVAKGFDIEDGASLKFHNMTSLIKFTLERTDVSYITFTAKGGEKIHGDGTLKITFNDDSPSASFGDSGGSSIKVTTGSAGIYFISTLPVKLTSGFEIQYFNASGKCFATTDFSSLVSLKANEILNLGTVDGRMSSKPEYVDLGLSVMWATCNHGALSPEEYGGYYQWGGLQDVTSTSINLGWSNCPYHTGSDSKTGWTKYVQSYMSSFWSGSGSPDNKSVLDLSDDVAHVKLGGRWRIPTDAEWTELKNNCTWTWTTQNGVQGYKVTSKKSGYTDKWIFLPAAGYRVGTSLFDVGSDGSYWSSSLTTDGPYYAYSLGFYSGGVYRYINYRCYGRSVRPVYGDRASVTGVSLSKASLTLGVDETYTLSASITPFNAAEQSINWSSNNSSIATVDVNGKVTAVKAGTATITVKTVDGGKTASCTVTVNAYSPESGFVDLGLSVKWATCNLGASKPEQYGGYYQWAGLQDVTSTSIDLGWSNCPYQTGSDSNTGWTKYVPSSESSYWSGSGSPDNKTVLDPEDDVAHVKLGGKWRIPTDEEWIELRNNCTWTWTTLNGVNGYRVTSKKAGYTSKSIFLPAAGGRDGTGLGDAGSYGYYWSSSLYTGSPLNACLVYFNSYDVNRYCNDRYNGRSVRPVSE